MYKFTWTNDEISLVLKSSKELLNANENEAQNDYAILRENMKFVKYLKSNVEGRGTKEEALLKAKLNNILDEENDCVEREEQHLFDMVKWLPLFTLSEFRKSVELCCLMIEDPSKDLSAKNNANYTKWKSRSDKHFDANAIRASDECEKITTDRWGLIFKNNLYSINHVSMSSGDTIFMCITFETSSTEEQVVISDYTEDCPTWRGVTVSSTFIKILGVDNEHGYLRIPFTVQKKQWVTVVVIWGGFHDDLNSSYSINGKLSARFRANRIGFMVSNRTSLGDIENEEMSKPLNGSISNIDLFQTQISIPVELQQLIMKNHIIQ